MEKITGRRNIHLTKLSHILSRSKELSWLKACKSQQLEQHLIKANPFQGKMVEGLRYCTTKTLKTRFLHILQSCSGINSIGS